MSALKPADPCLACAATDAAPLTERCERCGAEAPAVPPFALRADNFVAELRATAVTIALYRSDDCAPCRKLAPVFDQAAACRRHLRFAVCDVDADPLLAEAQHIANLPTIVVYAGGRERARISGTMRLSALLDWIAFQTDALVAAR
ncbi:thioredoxin family protein [Solimonas soli]|uniref:thioredoxin family protein n=1 Tax=Solimonas soli TaxID=413479 RepID=UPI0004B0D502|nr:thioredoxin family protein [Solimonas soli]